MSYKRIRDYAIIISLLLHLCILMLLQVKKFDLFPDASVAKTTPAEKEDRLVFELVETPAVPEAQPDAKSNYVSDKNTRAADLALNDLPEGTNPYQKGDTPIPEMGESAPESQKEVLPKQDEPAVIMGELQKKSKSFWETFEAKKELQKVQEADYENLLTQVKNHGGMSLNTYQWEFAPYLLEMKRKVQAHNNPPFAFTHLGAIDGDILLRFKVLQDGSVQDLEILNSTAHYSLEATSTRAIQFSAPFQPLPQNFPKDYLEVTALFSYIIRR
ncbi:MAG TPA: energy transducer TonB [Candidatus Cloacimonadota bacterium]|nr:energy transducer TonB [Candidatus Cloacimonadota bacterium]